MRIIGIIIRIQTARLTFVTARGMVQYDGRLKPIRMTVEIVRLAFRKSFRLGLDVHAFIGGQIIIRISV